MLQQQVSQGGGALAEQIAAGNLNPFSNQVRPPTLAECEAVIKHLQKVNENQAHEVFDISLAGCRSIFSNIVADWDNVSCPFHYASINSYMPLSCCFFIQRYLQDKSQIEFYKACRNANGFLSL